MAVRQEQEKSTEDVSEVGPGVLRMQLPIMLPGLGHVNCYALLDDDGAALVDPGLPGPGSFKALRQRLAQADLKVKDIHTVIVTHSHPDHFGGAGRIMDESGAKLIAHNSFDLEFMRPHTAKPEVSVRDLEAQEEQDASEAAAQGDEPSDAHVHHGHGHASQSASSQPNSSQPKIKPWAGRTPWGGDQPRPGFKMRMRFRMMRALGRAMRLPDVTDPVSEGDVVRLAGREWFIVHTPGHTEDHICLHDPVEGIFLAGDHVLPTITPHISGLSSNDDPLAAFFDSLDRAGATQHVSQALPAHGHPFDDLKARCEAIKIHHDERLGKVRSIAREIGPASVQAFTERLFKKRSWGAMAESETYAHLEHIRLQGEADRHANSDGKLIYVL